MKFHYKPNETVVQNIKNKMSGVITKHVVCKFDENGELETDDKKIIWILQNKLDCTWEGKEVETEEVKEILDDEEIRGLAKEKGIKFYWNKKIDNLKKELGV